MKHLLISLAVVGGLAMPATAAAGGFDFSKMNEAERKSFRTEVRKYLLANPEVIVEAIRILEQRRKQTAEVKDRNMVRDNAKELFEDGYSFVDGNPKGDVTIVEFLDYRCGYCRKAHPEVAKILAADKNIRLVVKEFPILGADSVAAGKMALAAMIVDRKKFKKLGDALMTFPGNLTEQVAYQIAGEIGYDVAKLKDSAKGTVVDDRLARNYQLASKLGLQGTPAFVIGNRIVRGYLPAQEMLAIVRQVRQAMNN